MHVHIVTLKYLHSCSDGQLHLWVVVEVLSPDPHGSDSDLGLVPRGQVKLVKSSSLNVSGGLAYCLQFRPGDTNHLYVGSDMVSRLQFYTYKTICIGIGKPGDLYTSSSMGPVMVDSGRSNNVDLTMEIFTSIFPLPL